MILLGIQIKYSTGTATITLGTTVPLLIESDMTLTAAGKVSGNAMTSGTIGELGYQRWTDYLQDHYNKCCFLQQSHFGMRKHKVCLLSTLCKSNSGNFDFCFAG